MLPSTGSATPASLILPAVTMAIPTSAMLAQVLTRSFADVEEAYITTARAAGLSRAAVQWRHAFRNASLPALTILGILAGNTVTGAIVAETIFARQGIGTLAQESVLTQDVPVVQAVVVLAAAVFVGINLLVDLLYPSSTRASPRHRRRAGHDARTDQDRDRPGARPGDARARPARQDRAAPRGSEAAPAPPGLRDRARLRRLRPALGERPCAVHRVRPVRDGAGRQAPGARPGPPLRHRRSPAATCSRGSCTAGR
ncbi:ABC transporter permease [Rathayibacter oskolensis]|uniref:ABC transporter permease subunit n=1 Tax=Rathayibacter oskolensis TaxID=1891671 RepID=UPI00265E8A55|nr:ABC transporter permease [Rathayibacter oskolensis]WKK71114.1 ABC transporter permease [Rathayibacter oskolensis]